MSGLCRAPGTTGAELWRGSGLLPLKVSIKRCAPMSLQQGLGAVSGPARCGMEGGHRGKPWEGGRARTSFIFREQL